MAVIFMTFLKKSVLYAFDNTLGVLLTATTLQTTSPYARADTFLYDYSFYDPAR